MEKIFVPVIPKESSKNYTPRYISINSSEVIGCTNSRNLSFHLGYCNKEQFEERVIPIRDSMNRYNDIVKAIWHTPGFSEYFAEHNLYVTKTELQAEFGDDFVSLVFSLKKPHYCYPDLIVRGDAFMHCNAGHMAVLNFATEEHLVVLDGNAGGYPCEIDGKICFWNWDGNETDYAFNFSNYLLENIAELGVIDSNSFFLEYYDQWRGDRTAIIEALDKIMDSMEERGYLKKYKLYAKNYKEVWSYYTETEDDSVGLYLCEKKAFKDKLLIARIKALLEAIIVEYDDEDNPMYGCLVDPDTAKVDFDRKYYFLQDKDNHTYISLTPAKFGGHNKLKIYGKLDCPSANRYLQKGEYIKHRVFFGDEETAKAAGYRPCGVCMKSEYKAWKEMTRSGNNL